jgi:hypothetical protein
MLSITSATDHIKSWVKSCETNQQLETCKNVLGSFITQKLYNISEFQCTAIKCEINDLISIQAVLIASNTTKKATKQRPPSDDEQQFFTQIFY